MKRMFLLFALLIVPAIHGQAPAGESRQEANKQLVLAFFGAGGKPELMASFLADDYIQHNPKFVKFNEDQHLSGKQGFLEALKSGILRPPAAAGAVKLPPRTRELIMAEGDLVTIVWKQVRPDPDDASKTYDSYNFDTVRLKDGKFAEHWDGVLR